jgi:hypothetical protein
VTTIIIPTAKYIPEDLQKIGKIPPILYPLEGRMVLDHILNNYGENDHVRLLCYEGVEIVRSRLKFNDERKIEIIEIEQLKSLGQTVLEGLDGISGPVVINFGDTIVGESMKHIQEDSFYYSEEYHSKRWTFFEIKDSVLEIIDRPPDSNVIGNAFVGVFCFSDSVIFKKCLRKYEDRDDMFYSAIAEYYLKYKLKPIKTDKWFDIGHPDRYIDSKRRVQARIFNHISVDKNRGMLTKHSDNHQKLIGEIRWYMKIPTDIEYCRPRIFSYSFSIDDPYVCMEYYSYHTVHELLLYGALNSLQWRDIFSRIHFVCTDMSRYTVSDDNIYESLNDMYLNKTIYRLEQITENPEFSNFKNNPIKVNGQKYKSINQIIDTLRDFVPKTLFDVNSFQVIHGDLCFTNILIDDNLSMIKLIDPRGKFGHYDIYGDLRYDLAKLFHSLEGGYDEIIKDMFDLNYDTDDCVINFKVKRQNPDIDLMAIFKDVFNDLIGEHEKEIRTIEALLFLSMVPLHGENLRRQLIMLGTGIELFSQVCDIREE